MAKRTGMVEIVPYNSEWKEQFEKISAMVINYIGDLIIKIEHVGSTSVEGLDAKPILDVDVVIDNYDVFPEIVERLEKQGYKYKGNLDVEGREVFHRMYPDGFSYNLNFIRQHHFIVFMIDNMAVPYIAWLSGRVAIHYSYSYFLLYESHSKKCCDISFS